MDSAPRNEAPGLPGPEVGRRAVIAGLACAGGLTNRRSPRRTRRMGKFFKNLYLHTAVPFGAGTFSRQLARPDPARSRPCSKVNVSSSKEKVHDPFSGATNGDPSGAKDDQTHIEAALHY